MKKKSIPPKGWPVRVNNVYGLSVIRISTGDVNSGGFLMVFSNGGFTKESSVSFFEKWKPIKLPNGKLLKWPESKGKKK